LLAATNVSALSAHNAFGWTPLHTAALGGDAPTVSLIARKLQRDSSSSLDLLAQVQQVSPLWLAASKGNVEAVKALVNAKAHVDACACDGSSPLAVSALMGFTEVVTALLNNGADPAKASRKGVLPVHAALSKGHRETGKVLLTHNHVCTVPGALNEEKAVGDGQEGVETLLSELNSLRGDAEFFNAELRFAFSCRPQRRWSPWFLSLY